MNIYTYSEAAALLGLRSRAGVRNRIKRLGDRGQPLTVEAGELFVAGARRLLTDAGVERLREYEDRRGKWERQPRITCTDVHQLV